MEKIGIIGYGVVGQALHYFLEHQKINNIIINDIKYKTDNFDEILKCDYVFICIPTPAMRDYTQSELFKLLNKFVNYNGIIIVRSTCSLWYYNNFKNLNLVAMPEFLNQNSPFEDCLKPPFILGGDYSFTSKVATALNICENCYYCTIEDAVNFKYTRNLLGAYKVLFWNFIQEFTGNARKMKQMLDMIPQGDLSQVGMDGEKGFGGKCFPKDLKQANFDFEYNNKYQHKLLKYMLDYNNELRINNV